MSLATLCERLMKVTKPLTAVRLVVPCSTPLRHCGCGYDGRVVARTQVAELVFNANHGLLGKSRARSRVGGRLRLNRQSGGRRRADSNAA